VANNIVELRKLFLESDMSQPLILLEPYSRAVHNIKGSKSKELFLYRHQTRL
jgi:hypothetical protein